MRLSGSLVLGLLGQAAHVVAQEASAAVELDRATFANFVSQNEVVMTEFYAPWCGHCQKFAPNYEAAAKALADLNSNVRLAKVDCTKQVKLCQEVNIRAYPTMKVYKGGKELYHEYDGPRRSSAIVEFMTKQVLPTVSTLTTRTGHDYFLRKENSESVLMAYVDNSDEESKTKIRAAAEKLHEDFPVGICTDASSALAADVKFPSIILYKAEGEGKINFDKAWDVDKIIEFAKKSSTPLIGETGAMTWTKYVSGSDGPTAFIFHQTDADRKRLANELRPVAKKYKGRVNFATAEVPDFSGFAGYLHLATEGAGAFPSLAIFDGSSKKKYPFDSKTKTLNEQEIDAFVGKFLAGMLEPTIKSEPIPASYDGPVTSVVAANFDQVVMDINKDVLLYYYREDCPYCQALFPVYESLASMYAAEDRAEKIVIAKMNILKNDVNEQIPYVPFVKLYKAKDKTNAAVYSGDRSIQDFIGFVKEHGNNGVDAIHEHPTKDDAMHGGSGGQQPLFIDAKPLQGTTPLKHLHDEL